MLAQTRAAFAQVCALTAKVFKKGGLVFLGRCYWGLGVGGFELGVTRLAVVDVTEEIEVVIEEVYRE